MKKKQKQKRTHSDNRKIICALCLRKDEKCYPMNKDREVITKKIRPTYSMDVHENPSGLCGNFRHYSSVNFLKSGKPVPVHIKNLWTSSLDIFSTSRDHSLCTVCTLASVNGNGLKKSEYHSKSKVQSSKNICGKCFSEVSVGRGKKHNCSPKAKVCLSDFIDNKGHSLGRYNEQAIESCHAALKPIVHNFSVSNLNSKS